MKNTTKKVPQRQIALQSKRTRPNTRKTRLGRHVYKNVERKKSYTRKIENI
jgi:hypothetical protein